jgi:RNA polymerase sigma factor (sigma-70 family)
MPGEGLSYVLDRLRRLVGATVTAGEGDGELLERFARGGDPAAFCELMQRHGPMVLALCRRLISDAHEAEDAFQSTFLVLAHKASSVRRQASVASWLYGVAHRVARRAARRRGRMTVDIHTTPVPDRSANSVEARLEAGELGRVIDKELNRLPEKYRAPLVLCYLEEKTNEEAARELGWPKGTVQGRLARAREVLKDRLSRRGVTLSVAALAALAGDRASALPPALVQSTSTAAALVVAGESVVGAISPLTALVTQGVLHDMLLTKLKWSLVVLAGIVAVGIGTTILVRPAASPAVHAAADPKPDADRKPGIAWGEPRDGLRLGLAPDQVFMLRDQKELKITVWYENVDTKVRQVSVQRDQNVLRLMYAGEKSGKPFFADYRMDRLAITTPKFEPLEPGKRLSEEFVIRPGEEWNFLRGVPALEPGESLTLRAGLCAKGDTNGEASWKAEDTLRSGAVKVSRTKEVAPLAKPAPGAARNDATEGKGPAHAAADPKPDAGRKPGIAWGEPRDGLRLGLAPDQVSMLRDQKELKITVWYENVDTKVRQVPVQREQNVLRLMYAGEKNGKPFFADYRIPRLAITTPKFEPLEPGKRLAEEFIIRPGEESNGLRGVPALEPGESLTLRAGLCAKGDTNGEASWKAEDTLRSGAVKVSRTKQDATEGPADAQLLGAWRGDKGKETVHVLFQADKCTLQGKEGTQAFRATYEPGLVLLKIYGKKLRVQATLKDGILTLTWPDENKTQVAYRKLDAVPAELVLKPLALGDPREVPEEKLKAVQRELAKRYKADQAVRADLVGDPQKANDPKKVKEMVKVDSDNTAYLVKTVKEVGWIDVPRFGKEASDAAFLLVQHSANVPLMLAALPLIEKDVQAKRLDGQPFALLYDRLQLMTGGKQRYGTQLGANDKDEPVVPAVEDRAKVDQYRKELGMVPLAEYLKLFETGTGKKIEILDD